MLLLRKGRVISRPKEVVEAMVLGLSVVVVEVGMGMLKEGRVEVTLSTLHEGIMNAGVEQDVVMR